jgi:hypothetical protein
MISFLLILFIDNDFAKKFILLTAFETMHQNRGIITFFNKNFVIILYKKLFMKIRQYVSPPCKSLNAFLINPNVKTLLAIIL